MTLLVFVWLLQTPAAKRPTAAADVGVWDAAIVRRAAALIPTPAEWDRAATGECPANAMRVSLQCALQQAADEAGAGQPAISACRFQRTIFPSGVPSPEGWVGTCGPLFDEVSIFSMAPAASVKTGTWRKDMTPRQVFAGTMSDAASPVMYEARQLVDVSRVMSSKPYSARLVDYNNDSETTFENLQTFFKRLEERVGANGAADLARSTDDVEIEVYDGGAGVIRTYEGWFPVTRFSMSADTMTFQFDGKHEVPPNGVDRAMIEVTGGFNHRRPAGQLVRQIVETRSADRRYSHRMMDYNNDPRTTMADVRRLFAEAIARIE